MTTLELFSQLGQRAFHRGAQRVPSHDAAVLPLISVVPGVVAHLDAWLRGWDECNVSTSYHAQAQAAEKAHLNALKPIPYTEVVQDERIIHTVAIATGRVVLSKKDGTAVVFANRSQAAKQVERLGEGWEVYQSSLSRRFYAATLVERP